VHRYSDYIQPEDHLQADALVAQLSDSELKNFVLDDIRVGEEAYAATLRYFFVGDLQGEHDATRVLRRYLQGAILTQWATRRLLEAHRPDVTVFHHGIYVPQGVIGQVARQCSVRVVNWSVGYRNQTFVYSHEDTYHRTMIDEPLASWRDTPLTQSQTQHLMDYLESRRVGNKDWMKIFSEARNAQEDHNAIRQSLGLDDRPVILLLTNVTWDAQLFYKSNGFPSLLDWVEATIRYFEQRPDLQLIIRIHPSESQRSSRQAVIQVMTQRLGEFPGNVHVVRGTSKLSTYALGEMADTVIIFGTKAGVEMTARGIPVIVAGEAWIRNKGITLDVSSEAEYRAMQDTLPLNRRMSPEQTALAQQYAYHYFFRRMITVRSFTPRTGSSAEHKSAPQERDSRWRKLRVRLSGKMRKPVKSARSLPVSSPYDIGIERLAQLAPGHDPGLDTICRGILTGSEFIYDALQPAYSQSTPETLSC
jgi:hypothetical protein